MPENEAGKRTIDSPIAENEQIKELLALLRENKTPGYDEFTQMIDCVSVIEQRLHAAVSELETIRRDIQTMQESTLKSSLKNTCRSLESTVASMQRKMTELKDRLIEGCKQILHDFKQRGVQALNGIAKLLHLRPAFEAIRTGAENCERRSARAMEKIDAAAVEYHTAGRHLKNMGRSLAGKEAVEKQKENGKVAEAIKAPYRAFRAGMGAVRRTAGRAAESLTRLEQKAVRPSVLKTMREAANQKKSERAAETPTQEKKAARSSVQSER